MKFIIFICNQAQVSVKHLKSCTVYYTCMINYLRQCFSNLQIISFQYSTGLLNVIGILIALQVTFI